jgi:hypothetical protein
LALAGLRHRPSGDDRRLNETPALGH